MTPSTPAVGLIGLGIMGSAIASNLLAAGFNVTGFDIDPKARARFASAGGTPGKDTTAVAAASDVLLTSLPSVAALDSVMTELERATAVRAGALAETSTFPLADKLLAQARLSAIGIAMLDCPLSGTGEQAKTRDVLVYGSGDAALFEQFRPVFDGFSRAPHYLGAFGAGSKMKYVANLLVAIHTAAAAEAFALARMAGLDPAQMFAVIADGAGGSNSLRARGPALIAERYQPVTTMPLSLWQKDLKLIAEFTENLACPTPIFSATLPLFNTAIASGYGDDDTAAVARVYRDLSGKPSVTET